MFYIKLCKLSAICYGDYKVCGGVMRQEMLCCIWNAESCYVYVFGNLIE